MKLLLFVINHLWQEDFVLTGLVCLYVRLSTQSTGLLCGTNRAVICSYRLIISGSICFTDMILICMFHLSFNYLSEESAVRSALRKLAEQRLQIAVLELGDKVDLKDLGEALRESRSHKVFPAQRSKKQKTKTHRELDETSDRVHRTNRSLFNVSLEPLNRLRGKLRRTQPRWKKKQVISVLLVAVENHGVDFGVLCVRWYHLTKLYTNTTVTIKKEINICE